jgi:hypothetical protein
MTMILRAYFVPIAISVLLVVVVFTHPVLSQQSIDFRDPDDISDIKRYRLPDWGYTVFRLNLSSNGSLYGLNVGNTSERSDNITGEFRPVLSIYRENENRISQIHTEVQTGIQYNRNKQVNVVGEAENKTSVREGRVLFSGNYAEYIDRSRFFFIGGNTGYGPEFRRQENVDIRIIKDRFDRAEFNIIAGVGIGRIRNVTPVVRALRFRERARALNLGDAIGPEHIYRLARHIATEPGYNTIYSRPSRHFLGDMFSTMEPVIGEPSPYEVLYLTDVFREAVGVRLEGWDIRLGLLYNFQYVFRRTEVENINFPPVSPFSSKTIYHTTGPRISASYYKNLSLRHQFGIESFVLYGLYIREDTPGSTYHDRELALRVHPKWLMTITDRILFNAELINDIIIFYYDKDRVVIEDSETRRIHSLLGSVNYFIEDKVVLTGSFDYTNRNPYYYNNPQENSYWTLYFSVGMTYYFLRGM